MTSQQEGTVFVQRKAGNAMLDALSERMLKHGGVQAWRSVFLGGNAAGVRFETAQLTLLAADAPMEGFDREERRMLAHRLGGALQPSRAAGLLMAFADAASALRAAMVLQRLSSGSKVRVVLSTAACNVAWFRGADGGEECVALGTAVEEAEQALAHAPRGTVFLSGATCALLGEIDTHVRDAVVTTEMEEDTVTGASITLAPPSSAFMSTFAGLGLS
jgi:hypothetical protein